MARIFRAKKSKRGKAVKCSKCSKAIEPGSVHQYFFRRFSKRARGIKVIVCGSCRIRHTDTSSSKLAEVHDAIDDAYEAIGGAETPDDIASALRDLAQVADDVKDQYDESLNNMPEQLQSAITGEEIQEKIDALESFSSELEQAAQEIEDGDNDPGDDEDKIEELREQARSAVEAFEL